MYGDAKKIHLIEEILKIDNDLLLDEVEKVISKNNSQSASDKSFKDFAGIWTAEEAEDMKRIIEETCEQINPGHWK